MRQLLKTLLACLLPPQCVSCGAKAGTDSLCAACRLDLPPLGPACPICAQPTAHGQVCGSCLSAAPHFDATLAGWRYAFPLDSILQRYKYQPDLHLLGMLQTLLPTAKLPTVDAIIAVPSTPAHLKRRGFNPALELARPLARATGVPLHADTVRRPFDAPAQASLPWKERAANLKNAFTCAADLSGQHVLVVDDVMTTGATLNEMARTLKRHGAARVSNLVLARAVKD